MQMRESRAETFQMTLPSEDDLYALHRSCPRLERFVSNVLENPALGQAKWELLGGVWRGGVTYGDE